MIGRKFINVLSVIVTLVILGSCSVSGDKTPAAQPVSPDMAITSLGADGWASTNGGTTGGDGAPAANIYTVRDRASLVAALGTVTNTLKKIIYVKGTIDLCVDESNVSLTEASFIATVNGVTYSKAAYLAAYDPAVWGRVAIPATDPMEAARKQSQANQKARVLIPVSPNTSIIGIAEGSRIINGNLYIKGVDNVVIRNIEFKDAYDFFPQWDPLDSYSAATNTGGRWNSAYDLISIESSTHVWIDHCTFSDGSRPDSNAEADLLFGQEYQHHDALIDITKLSNYITISYNYFFNHDKVGLIGSSDTATAANGYGALSVTLHHNRYEDCKQRMPRVRFGKVHFYNNYFHGELAKTSTDPVYPFSYAFGIGQFARLYSENNAFNISDATVTNLYSLAHKLDTKVIDNTYFYDIGTILNGASVDIFTSASANVGTKPAILKTNTVWTPLTDYIYTLDASSNVKSIVVKNAGNGKL